MYNSENKRHYMDGCLCGNWIDVEVNEENLKSSTQHNYQRKDLQTLLDELEEIKRNIERIAEKERILEDLLRIHQEEDYA
jgi:hypothetical protein